MTDIKLSEELKQEITKAFGGGGGLIAVKKYIEEQLSSSSIEEERINELKVLQETLNQGVFSTAIDFEDKIKVVIPNNLDELIESAEENFSEIITKIEKRERLDKLTKNLAEIDNEIKSKDNFNEIEKYLSDKKVGLIEDYVFDEIEYISIVQDVLRKNKENFGDNMVYTDELILRSKIEYAETGKEIKEIIDAANAGKSIDVSKEQNKHFVNELIKMTDNTKFTVQISYENNVALDPKIKENNLTELKEELSKIESFSAAQENQTGREIIEKINETNSLNDLQAIFENESLTSKYDSNFVNKAKEILASTKDEKDFIIAKENISVIAEIYLAESVSEIIEKLDEKQYTYLNKISDLEEENINSYKIFNNRVEELLKVMEEDRLIQMALKFEKEDSHVASNTLDYNKNDISERFVRASIISDNNSTKAEVMPPVVSSEVPAKETVKNENPIFDEKDDNFVKVQKLTQSLLNEVQNKKDKGAELERSDLDAVIQQVNKFKKENHIGDVDIIIQRPEIGSPEGIRVFPRGDLVKEHEMIDLAPREQSTQVIQPTLSKTSTALPDTSSIDNGIIEAAAMAFSGVKNLSGVTFAGSFGDDMTTPAPKFTITDDTPNKGRTV